MEKILKAAEFANEAHKHQKRKSTDLPYITHPLSVGLILSKFGAEEDEIIAGLLHDVIEDTEYTYEDIKNEFGQKIADIVLQLSEEKELPWEERKKQHIDHLKEADISTKRVALADKLANLYSIKHELKEYGENLWNRFSRGKEQQKWYYTSMVEACGSGVEDEVIKKLYEEAQRVLKEIFTD